MPPTDLLETTNADLQDMVGLLRRQRARAVDVIGPVTSMVCHDGRLILTGLPQDISDDGVTDPNGTYDLTGIAMGHIAELTRVPVRFLRRMHAERRDVFDMIVNKLIHGEPVLGHEPMGSRQMFRLLQGDEPGTGFVRAVLSDAYKIINNLDVLLAVLDGVAAAGHPVDIVRCDLTERKMYVQIRSEAVSALATDLVSDYRSPYSDARGRDYPLVFAGFVVTNSETGDGKFALIPRLTWQVCKNGQTRSADAIGEIHLGSRNRIDGIVKWSAETVAKEVELVRLRTADAIAAFMDAGYIERVLNELRAQYNIPVEHPEVEVRRVTSALAFSDEEADLILANFIRGGQLTAGGLMQAVTAFSQHESVSPDRAFEIEDMAVQALTLAARRR